MDYSRKRSAAVTVVAVLAILGSLFLLLCCAVVFFGMLVKLPSTTPEVPPFMRIALLATEGLMMCLSLFGMATGIVLFYLRHWVHIFILICCCVLVFIGILRIYV